MNKIRNPIVYQIIIHQNNIKLSTDAICCTAYQPNRTKIRREIEYLFLTMEGA